MNVADDHAAGSAASFSVVARQQETGAREWG